MHVEVLPAIRAIRGFFKVQEYRWMPSAGSNKIPDRATKTLFGCRSRLLQELTRWYMCVERNDAGSFWEDVVENIRISLVASVFVFFCMNAAFAQEPSGSLLQQATRGILKPATINVARGATISTRTAPFFSGGLLAAARAAADSAGAAPANDPRSPGLGLSSGTVGCGDRDSGHNTRVNQDCTFRRQAEESIVFNPADRRNLLAAQNDSRVGANQCGIAFSTDDGRHWGDMLPPFRSKINNPVAEEPTPTDPNSHTIRGGPGTFHTYDAASDPGVAFDSQGRGFFSCIAFDIFSNASMVFVTQSPLAASGSFFFNISSFGRSFVVDEENSAAASLDKPFIRADTFTGSPNRDNVYATWTVFNFTCGPRQQSYCSSTIFGSMSTDHGMTWSTPEEISGASPLCFFGNFFDPTRPPNSCDMDQGSDPVVLPNGAVVATFFNGNTAANNPNAQQLAVVCHPTGSSPAGTAHMNCAPPVKVGDDILVGEPVCDFGRGPEECIPGAFIRSNDFPRIAVNKTNGHLYVTWTDYRNGEYDIQMARSLDGGATWGPTATVNPDTGLDHYFAAIDVVETTDRDRVGLSYFRTARVLNENTTPAGGVFAPGQPGVQAENSDYVLAGGTNLALPYSFKVVSPVFAPPDGIQAGFNGDYSGLTINSGEKAHPIWSDTRNTDPFTPADGVVHDEDVFTDDVGLPSGHGSPGVGQIGKSSRREDD
jgi:hypothetical protein